MSNQLLQEDEHRLASIVHHAFFEKLAAYNIVPQNQDEAMSLLEMADILEEQQQTATKQASQQQTSELVQDLDDLRLCVGKTGRVDHHEEALQKEAAAFRLDNNPELADSVMRYVTYRASADLQDATKS